MVRFRAPGNEQPFNLVCVSCQREESGHDVHPAHRDHQDRPDTYILIVEFSTYDDAMANSALPETADFAERLAELCDSPPIFRNLDVERVDELSTDP